MNLLTDTPKTFASNSIFLSNSTLPFNKSLWYRIVLDEETDDYDTLGGFLINQMDYIPSETEECMVEYENVLFKVEGVKDKRIEKVKICINDSQ